MLALEVIAERRIEEAVARGEQQGLPGERDVRYEGVARSALAAGTE